MLTGGIFLILGCILCYLSYESIFLACEHTQIKDYSGLVEKLLPNFINNIFKFTYFLDMQAFTVVYAIFGWKIFEFLLQSFGLINNEWLLPKSD